MPLSKTSIGQQGEQQAASYLLEKGYIVLESNYRYRRAELDLIAQDGDTLVFVEVKFRKNSRYGFPESFVDEAKMERLRSAADHYLFTSQWQGPIRFDIIAILSAQTTQIEHFIDCV